MAINMNTTINVNSPGRTRDRVLLLLESNTDRFISGEGIAAQLDISRTAVWKAVRSLRNDGYMIESVTNRGYRLAGQNDILSAVSIRKYLHDSARTETDSGIDDTDIDIDIFDTIDSTNNVCLRRASSIPSGAQPSAAQVNSTMTGTSDRIYVAVSGEQTAGKGRRGRSFFSPGNTGLYMSILLRPSGLAADQAIKFTTIAAVAVCEAIEEVSGLKAYIKWVNDIYAGGRKVCGILTEASFNPEDGSLDYAVCGIGINVYEPEGGFPADIADRAASLAGIQARNTTGAGRVRPGNAAQYDPGTDSGEYAGTIISAGGRNRIAAEIIMRFLSYSDEILHSSDTSASGSYVLSRPDADLPRYVSEYRRRCFVIGHDIDVLISGREPVKAFVTGIDDECRLIVRYEDGRMEALSSGEISITDAGCPRL